MSYSDFSRNRRFRLFECHREDVARCAAPASNRSGQLVKDSTGFYTGRMNVVATLFILILSAQLDSPSQAEWPDAIQLKNGDIIYAFVDEDQWKKTQMKVMLDAPWLDPWERRSTIWSRDIEDTYRETTGERTRRIVEGYAAAGFVQVEAKGGERWIHESEIALAERAFELETLTLERTSADADAEAEIVGEALVEPITAPFLELWGMHIALASAALVLAGLMSWGFIRS